MQAAIVGKSGIRTWLVLVGVLLSPAGATAQEIVELLRPSVTVTASANAIKSEGVVRERLVALDPASLARAVAPPGFDHAENRPQVAASTNARIGLALFPDVTAIFRKRALEKAFGGGYIWTGDAALGATATLVVIDN